MKKNYPKTIEVINTIIENSPKTKKEFIFFIPANCPFDKDECRKFFESHFEIVSVDYYVEKVNNKKIGFFIVGCEDKLKKKTKKLVIETPFSGEIKKEYLKLAKSNLSVFKYLPKDSKALDLLKKKNSSQKIKK
jgi:hypothetical protein